MNLSDIYREIVKERRFATPKNERGKRSAPPIGGEYTRNSFANFYNKFIRNPKDVELLNKTQLLQRVIFLEEIQNAD